MGHAHVVRQLLRHPDIQVNANAGVTYLGIACVYGHVAVDRELLGHPGLDAGSIRFALMISEALRRTAVVEVLRGRGGG